MTSKKFHAPAHWQFRSFRSRPGSDIRYGFASPTGPSLGTVVVTGGYGRHMEYYFEQINNWLDRGYSVYAMDWDGMGGSSRENPDKRQRPPLKDFEHHVETLHEFVSTIVKPAPEKPAFLSSHSKGGNIVLRYLNKYEKTPGFPFQGAVLGAPMINIYSYMLPRVIFRRAVAALDTIGLSHMPLPSIPKLLLDFHEAVFGGNPLGPDREREKIHDHYKEKTENLEIGYPTVGWLRQAIRSSAVVSDERFLRNTVTPVLILTAASDQLVCTASQDRAARLLPNGRQIVFPDAKHGIWYDHDSVQNRMWRHIDSFTMGIRTGQRLAQRPDIEAHHSHAPLPVPA